MGVDLSGLTADICGIEGVTCSIDDGVMQVQAAAPHFEQRWLSAQAYRIFTDDGASETIEAVIELLPQRVEGAGPLYHSEDERVLLLDFGSVLLDAGIEVEDVASLEMTPYCGARYWYVPIKQDMRARVGNAGYISQLLD